MPSPAMQLVVHMVDNAAVHEDISEFRQEFAHFRQDVDQHFVALGTQVVSADVILTQVAD